MHDFVRAYALEASDFHRGLDEVNIGLVEIKHATSLKIGLLSKPHYDKTGATFWGGVWQRWHIFSPELSCCRPHSRSCEIGYHCGRRAALMRNHYYEFCPHGKLRLKSSVDCSATRRWLSRILTAVSTKALKMK